MEASVNDVVIRAFRLPAVPSHPEKPGILSRFTTSPELRRPYHLPSDAEATKVNAFLKAVNQTFPRGSLYTAGAGAIVGLRTVEKEVAGRIK